MKKTNWKLYVIILVGTLSIILLGVVGIQSSQNKAFSSDIKVQEERRVDLIYNIVDCIKQNVTTAITAVSEAYPELKSNENYKELINELSITENLITEYRSNYNRQIKEYNRYVREWNNIFFWITWILLICICVLVFLYRIIDCWNKNIQ